MLSDLKPLVKQAFYHKKQDAFIRQALTLRYFEQNFTSKRGDYLPLHVLFYAEKDMILPSEKYMGISVS